MLCPNCKADTRVIDSRPETDGKVIQRRRVCGSCQHRFKTWESTLNVVARRQRAAAATQAYRRADPERAREQDARRSKTRSMRNMARAESAETGRPLPEILSDWGLNP